MQDAGAEAASDKGASQVAEALLLDKEVDIIWLVFVTFFASLVVITGVFFVQTDGRTPSVKDAVRHAVFWFAAAFAFNLFLLGYLGIPEAKSWLIGYMLEYTLSFDNLFVYHLVFTAYRAPTAQIHRGIFFGMCWGTWVRLTLFVAGESLFNGGALFKWIFGAIMLYSGFKVLFFDEEDGDPTDNAIVRAIARCIPLHPHYSDDGAFFVCIDEKLAGDWEASPSVLGRLEAAEDNGQSPLPISHQFRRDWAIGTAVRSTDGTGKWKATPLLLALLTLMVADAVLSMDSITAKVAMVDQYDSRIDLFLNFTSTAFAMLCMPNLYYVIELMIPLFRFLKYGIGTILVMIGLKLLLARWVEVQESTSCIVMLSILTFSVLLSLVVPAAESEEKDDAPEGEEELEEREGLNVVPALQEGCVEL